MTLAQVIRYIVAAEVVAYLVVGALFFRVGDWRLGGSQLLLAGVQALIYLR